ncbi:uncharacterized protein LOC133796291 isoform X1 [Humulus lupulus]|uniref:uncharacterized protein LOC133796291 isoform X1 n=1 Tax=Humulus lupulus TaxID=3486 RepID=UPI002B407625|nr:uncharacterized protein LOC133796291 isoform X1 [Humulus lupulus]
MVSGADTDLGAQPHMDELVDQIIEDIEFIKEEHRNFRKFLPKDCRQKSQDSYDEGISELQSLEHIHILVLTQELDKVGIEFTVLTHLTKEQRMFADKMSKKRVIKIPKASDAVAKDKLTAVKRPKTSGSKQVSEVEFSVILLTQSSLGTCTTIKRKVDFLDPEVPDETVLRIPHTVSVYSNTASIEGHVSGLLHPAN